MYTQSVTEQLLLAENAKLRAQLEKAEQALRATRGTSECKHLEEPAQRNELRLRLALDAAYLISFEWDIQRDEVRRYVSTDPGLPPTLEEMPSTFADVSRVVHPEDLEGFTANVHAALAREDGHYGNEFRIIHPDGKVAWLSESGRVLRDAVGRPEYLIGLSKDITAQKLNEQLLRQSQQRYSGIVESAMDAIITVDIDQRILLFNAAAEKMFGCPAQEAIGSSLVRFIPEQFRDAHGAHLHAFSSTSITCRKMGGMGTITGLRASDEEFPLEVSISQSGTNEEKSFTAILRDVSERQRAEETLRESERRFRLALKNSMVAVAIQDHNLVYQWAYNQHTRLPEEIIGKTDADLFSPEDVPHILEFKRRVLESGKEARKQLWVMSNGQRLFLDVSCEPLRDSSGQITGIGITSVNLTEQKQTEEALRQSREDLARAQAVGQLGSWRLDVGRNVLTWSEESYRIFGIPQDTPLTYESFLETIHPDDHAYVDSQWRAALHGEPYDLEHRIMANGRVKWVREKAYLELSDTGELLGGFGITQDITERKLAVIALKEADLRKDEFLAMLAHELRNPLVPIRNAVQILRLTAPKEPALTQVSGMIERQVNQLVRLVDDLLDVSRVSRGKIQLQKTPLDLAAIIRQAIETTQPLIDARRHSLIVAALPPPTLRAEGDFARLAQVISNLLNNAAKYTDEGGMIWLTVESFDAGNEVLIRVRDTGQGIDPAALDSLFDLFYQADRNLARSDGGLGIGLSLVKSLVEMHGGCVEAHSAGLGKGSEFIIRLPGLPAELQLPQIAAVTPAPAINNQRILLVEDNPDVADSMSMLLRIYSYDVLLARDGREGVELALRERPAVVLMDIGLPYLDGYQACRAMRDGGLIDTLIVALSGYSQEEDQRKAVTVGFDRHLAKPVDPQALLELLASSEKGS